MTKNTVKIHSYIGAIFLIVGFVSLRFTFHEEVYLFPVTLISIGLILLVIAAVKRKSKEKKEH